jgi:hypothetical protein
MASVGLEEQTSVQATAAARKIADVCNDIDDQIRRLVSWKRAWIAEVAADLAR